MSKNFLDFVLLVKKMRECQQRYFKTRDKAILITSKQLEASVDKFIAERYEHDADGDWLLYEDEYTNAWECSSCHEVVQLMDGSPFENGWHYCPYCGLRMEKEERNHYVQQKRTHT